LGRSSTALLFYGYPPTDSSTVGALLVLTEEGKPAVDSVVFTRPSQKANNITSGVEFSAVAQWQDTIIVGAGRGGIALVKASAEGNGVLAKDSLNFTAFPAGSDTGVAAFHCIRNASCSVAQLATINDKIG